MRQRWRKTFRNYSRYNPDTEHQYYQYASGKPYVGDEWNGFTSKNQLYTGKDDYLEYLRSFEHLARFEEFNRRNGSTSYVGRDFKSIFKRNSNSIFDRIVTFPNKINIREADWSRLPKSELATRRGDIEHFHMRHKRRMDRFNELARPFREEYMNKIDTQIRNTANGDENTNGILKDRERQREFLTQVVTGESSLRFSKVDGRPFSNAGKNMDQE